MQKYVCEPCGYIYDPAAGDPDNGIDPGTAFEDLPVNEVSCELKGVVSRKKQLIPAFMMALQNQ